MKKGSADHWRGWALHCAGCSVSQLWQADLCSAAAQKQMFEIQARGICLCHSASTPKGRRIEAEHSEMSKSAPQFTPVLGIYNLPLPGMTAIQMGDIQKAGQVQTATVAAGGAAAHLQGQCSLCLTVCLII